MGDRGPAPRRDAERRRVNAPAHPIVKMGQAELQRLPFAVDMEPEPPAAGEHWEPKVKDFWAALIADPARKWMTSADWEATYMHFESMSRDLGEQVVGITEHGTVVKDRVPIKGANLGAYQKWFATIGVGEANRLRMQKEITLFPPPPTELGDGSNVRDIRTAREADVE